METIINNAPVPPSIVGTAIDASAQYTDLVDIEDLKIDPALSKADRFLSFIQQIRNPYVFRCNGVVVQVMFADTTATIEDRLEEYIRQRHRKELENCTN